MRRTRHNSKYLIRRKNTTRKIPFRLLRCAPNVYDNTAFKDTCYTTNSFKKLRDSWNKRNQNEMIRSDNPKTIWVFLKKKMNSTCENERCWLEQEFMKNNVDTDLKLYTFAPSRPKSWEKNIYEWLDSNDIKRIMRQYEQKFSNFSFIGPSPVDYYNIMNDGRCVWDDLCHFNLENQIKRKDSIGIIFNLDPHYKDGSHWVSLYLDLKDGVIYYFDSVGKQPHQDIERFISDIQGQARALGTNYDVVQNNIQHQQHDGQCGMYSIFFILSMLLRNKQNKKDITLHLLNKRIGDHKMEQLRNILFNKND
jgi:hypothetical protein